MSGEYGTLTQGIMTTIIGMTGVFLILVLLAFSIYWMGRIYRVKPVQEPSLESREKSEKERAAAIIAVVYATLTEEERKFK